MSQDGKMIVRMIVIQLVQGQIMNRKQIKPLFKILFLFVLFFALLAYDLRNFYTRKRLLDNSV